MDMCTSMSTCVCRHGPPMIHGHSFRRCYTLSQPQPSFVWAWPGRLQLPRLPVIWLACWLGDRGSGPPPESQELQLSVGVCVTSLSHIFHIICNGQGAPVRFGSVTVRGWNGSSGSGFRFRRFLCEKGFSAFQYSLKGKDGSGFGSWKTVPTVPVPLSVSGRTVPTVPVSGSGSVPEWSLGKGMRRSRNRWKEVPLRWMRARHSVNQGFGKKSYRKDNAVKGSGPFTEPLDSEDWNFLSSSTAQVSAPTLRRSTWMVGQLPINTDLTPYLTCFHASFFPFCPLCWPPLFLPFSRHIFALFSPSKSALFCRAKGTAQSLERGTSGMDLYTKFRKEIPSRNLRKKSSVT